MLHRGNTQGMGQFNRSTCTVLSLALMSSSIPICRSLRHLGLIFLHSIVLFINFLRFSMASGRSSLRTSDILLPEVSQACASPRSSLTKTLSNARQRSANNNPQFQGISSTVRLHRLQLPARAISQRSIKPFYGGNTQLWLDGTLTNGPMIIGVGFNAIIDFIVPCPTSGPLPIP